MKEAPSILWQVAGLALAAILAVLIVGAGALLATPASSLSQMTISDAAAALRQEDAPALRLRHGHEPPQGRYSPLLTAAVSDALGRSADRVRAVWLETPTAVEAKPATQAVTLLAGQEAVVEAAQGGFLLTSGSAARLRRDTPLPAFAAALKTANGDWLIAAPQEPLLTPWRASLLLAFIGSCLLLAPLVLLVARHLTRPIRALAQASQKMRLNEGQGDIPLSGPAEVRAAAAALNAMRRRLAQEVEQRTRMLAAMAHDLRNPLTGLRIRAENAPAPDRERMIADIDRMSGMIGQVLDYARGREARTSFVAADLAALVQTWAQDDAWRSGTVSIGRTAAGTNVLCRPEELRRAFTNLVDNALRFAGSAHVSVHRDDVFAFVEIEDEGPGIDPAEVARLLRPFERLEPSRSRDRGGVGLGLSIAQEIVAEHQGSIELRPRQPKGLAAAIRLPLLAEAANLYS